MEGIRDPGSVTPDNLSHERATIQQFVLCRLFPWGPIATLRTRRADGRTGRRPPCLVALAGSLGGRGASRAPCATGLRRRLTGSSFRNDVGVRLPNRPRFVFGYLAWCPVPAHRMWVGLSRSTGIAHAPFLNTGGSNDRGRVHPSVVRESSSRRELRNPRLRGFRKHFSVGASGPCARNPPCSQDRDRPSSGHLSR